VKCLQLVRLVAGQTPQTAATGVVADVAVFPDGRCILVWRTDPAGIEIYPSEDALRQVREASGRAVFRELLVVRIG
jgi:hypothetical protein